MKPERKIGAVILAAGHGRRMGGPKWQAEIAGHSFLDHVLQTLRDAGLVEIVCVVGGPWAALVRDLYPAVTFVPNDQPDDGMFSSVKIGVAQLVDLPGVLIVPVDHPLVRASTCTALMEEFLENPDSVVKPVHQGHTGHPILIPQRLFAEIIRSENETSLSELLRTSNVRQVRLPCDDPGVLHNLNTPHDRSRVYA